MQQRYLIPLLLLLLTSVGIAQNCHIDNLEKYHDQLKSYIQRLESEIALSFSDSILQSLKSRSIENCENLAWFRLDHGEALELNVNFEETLNVYYGVAREAEENNWTKILAHTHISIARCFESIGMGEESFRQLQLARQIITMNQLDTVYARFCLRYSSYHRIFGNIDSAGLYASRSIELGQKFNVERSVFDGHLLMGIVSVNPDTAIFHSRRAQEIFQERGDYLGVSSQCINITSRLIDANRFNDAMLELNECLTHTLNIRDRSKYYYRVMMNIHDLRRVIYEKQGPLDSAYKYLKITGSFKEKSEWHINQESISTNAIKFAIEKEKEKLIYLERTSRVLWIGLLLLSLAIGIFVILLINNRKKRREIDKQNKHIQVQNEKLEEALHKQSLLLSEVHHRVKNNLQLVISLLTLQGHDSNSKVLSNLLEDVSGKVIGIALIHEQLYSTGEFEDIDIKIYLENLLSHFKNLQSKDKDFNTKIEIDNFLLNLETVLPLGIICTELIGNSLKYANLPDRILTINISMHSFDNSFVFKYADNGPGIIEKVNKKKKSRMGLMLIKNMVRQLQAESKMYSDKGAHFSMVFVEKKVSRI